MKDQVVLITGASAGIGAALAREYARRGASVVLTARRTDKLEALATELRQGGTRALVVAAEAGAPILVVSQFTLAADVSGGNRPSFTQAAAPGDGRRLYDYLVDRARATHPVVQTGRFAADMKVHLVNDGPVTIPLRVN